MCQFKCLSEDDAPGKKGILFWHLFSLYNIALPSLTPGCQRYAQKKLYTLLYPSSVDCILTKSVATIKLFPHDFSQGLMSSPVLKI